jgi:hypothetical protein
LFWKVGSPNISGWADDRDSHVGRLDRGLDEAGDRGWVVVDMKEDWSTVYPTE